jgi:hypothetical protein
MAAQLLALRVAFAAPAVFCLGFVNWELEIDLSDHPPGKR